MANIEVLEKIKDHLKEYLVEHNRFQNNHVQCIFEDEHKHGDKNASASIVPNNPKIIHCFGCGRSYTIFTVAHALEGLPLSGPEFWTITVPTLATKYNIDYDPGNIDQDTKEVYQMRRFYEDVKYYIREHCTGNLQSYIQSRDWSVETCSELSIGGIDSRKNLNHWLISQGWSSDDITAYKVSQPDLFNEDNLIFTIHNMYGKPIAFVGRYIKFKKGTRRPKYVNSRTSQIYQKSKTLYGFNNARKYAKDNITDPLYIVEGYGDYLRLYQLGLKNVAALGGVDLSPDHVSAIEDVGYREIVLVLDSDMGGRNGLMRAANLLKNYRNLRTYVLVLPKGMDPDDYFKDHPLTNMTEIELGDNPDKEVNKIELFVYFARVCVEQYDTVDAISRISEYISGFDSVVNRNRILQKICNELDLDVDEISAEVEIKLKDASKEREEELDKIKTQLFRMVRNPQADIKVFLPELFAKFNRVLQHRMIAPSSPKEETNQYIHQLEEKFNNSSQQDTWNLPDFAYVNDYILEGGIPKGEPINLIIGGATHAGKTILMKSMILQVLEAGATVVYIAIDEGAVQALRTLISAHANMPLRCVKRMEDIDSLATYPEYVNELDQIKDNVRNKIRGSINYFKEKIKDKKFFILNKNVNTMTQIEMAVQDLYRQCGEEMFLFVDSFQQIGGGMSADGSTDYEGNMQRFKNLVNWYSVPSVMTSELIKPASDRRPKLSDLAETRKLAHLAEIIILCYNSSMSKSGSKKIIKSDKIGNVLVDQISNKRFDSQVIEYEIAKNRFTGKYCTFLGKVYPWSVKLVNVEEGELSSINSGQSNNSSLI